MLPVHGNLVQVQEALAQEPREYARDIALPSAMIGQLFSFLESSKDLSAGALVNKRWQQGFHTLGEREASRAVKWMRDVPAHLLNENFNLAKEKIRLVTGSETLASALHAFDREALSLVQEVAPIHASPFSSSYLKDERLALVLQDQELATKLVIWDFIRQGQELTPRAIAHTVRNRKDRAVRDFLDAGKHDLACDILVSDSACFDRVAPVDPGERDRAITFFETLLDKLLEKHDIERAIKFSKKFSARIIIHPENSFNRIVQVCTEERRFRRIFQGDYNYFDFKSRVTNEINRGFLTTLLETGSIQDITLALESDRTDLFFYWMRQINTPPTQRIVTSLSQVCRNLKNRGRFDSYSFFRYFIENGFLEEALECTTPDTQPHRILRENQYDAITEGYLSQKEFGKAWKVVWIRITDIFSWASIRSLWRDSFPVTALASAIIAIPIIATVFISPLLTAALSPLLLLAIQPEGLAIVIASIKILFAAAMNQLSRLTAPRPQEAV